MMNGREGVTDQPTVIMAALALSIAGALFYNMLPLYLGVAQDDFDLATSDLGLINATFFLGYIALTASAFSWIRRWSWRRVTAIAAPTAVLCLSAGALLPALPSLLIFSALSGAAFGALYGIGATAIGDTTQPTRWYGVKITLEGAVGAVLFLILPGTLVADFGFAGLVGGMVVTLCLLMPLFFLLPHGLHASAAEPDASDQHGSTAAAWLLLLGILLFFGGETTLWAFVERLGNDAGFSAEDVGNLLSLTLVGALSGSMVAAILGDRFGNVVPFVAACAIFIAALLVLSEYQTFTRYAVGAIAVMFSVGCGISFAVAEVARQDPDGRFVVLTVPAIGVGAMIGPAIAGWLAEHHGFEQVLIFGALTVGASVPLFLIATKISRARR